MSGTATIPADPSPELGSPHPAIEPQRVLILDDTEQRLLLTVLENALPRDEGGEWANVRRLHNLIAYGPEYVDAADQLDRVTLAKRRLESEIKRHNRTIATVETAVVEEILARGDTSLKRAATGSTLLLDKKIYAKVVREGEKPTDEEKGAAGEALIRAGLGDYVKPGFNTNSISAYFRELIKQHEEEQKLLPEHKRVTKAPDDFIPEALRGFFELDQTPKIEVRKARAS